MKDPAFLFYPGDWMGGTQWLTFEQKGCYMELLVLQFNTWEFTEEQAKQVLSICFEVAWAKIKHKFIFDNGFYYNNRLREEMIKRKKFTESRKINGLRPKNKNKKLEAYAKHMEDENENENIYKKEEEKEGVGGKEDVISLKPILNFSPEFYPFDEFWNDYDKKRGDKESLRKKWGTVSVNDRKVIKDYIPLYKESEPNKKFRKDPGTFLNQKSWNDEIITNKKTPFKQHVHYD